MSARKSAAAQGYANRADPPAAHPGLRPPPPPPPAAAEAARANFSSCVASQLMTRPASPVVAASTVLRQRPKRQLCWNAE